VDKRAWLWVGNYPEKSLAEEIVEGLSTAGLLTSLQPVGLTPGKDGWRTREYRLMVRAEADRMAWGEVSKRIGQIVPQVSPVEIELPADIATGTLWMDRPGGQRHEFNPPVELSSQEPIEIMAAPIGEGFHWQHTESLSLPTPVWIAPGSDGKLCSGVEIEIEDYLASVNSSEMPAESPPEFLKAQVVAARSWLLANWGSQHAGEPYIVCGGDHCQCYQGLSRVVESSRTAMESTGGQVLMHSERICDARYAKSCGGVIEPAANVWPFVNEPYLSHLRDLPGSELLDLSEESALQEFQKRWRSSDACCSPGYAELKGQLAELGNLYRWREEISSTDLSAVIQAKSGCDPGDIEELVPRRRGPSGRLIELEVVGSKERLFLSPELEIRRVLSDTHLPSSAFWIQQKSGKFIFHGMGWGHGVGMCQVGAASLAVRGYDYNRILEHYYPKTRIEKIY